MYRLYLLIILTLVNVNILKAGGESVVNSSKIKDFVVNNNNTWQVNPAHTLTVKDPKWDDLLTNKFTDESVVTRVWLKIDHSIIDYTQQGFNTTVNLKIVYKTLSGGTFVQSTQYKDLVLEYNPAVNNETQKDIQVVEIPGAYYAEVSLTGLSLNYLTIGGGNQPLNLYPANVKLEVEESVNRNYSEAFFFSSVANFNINNLSSTAVNNANTGGIIQLHWDYTPSAEEYEVEWAHINDYGTAGNSYLNTSEVTYNFRNNATRVRISDNFYTIPLTFDHGYLVYRVRPVGKEANSVYDLFGNWSIVNESGTVANLTAGQDYYQVTTPFQNTLNWQYIATYAEEGKNKLLMNYMDGTLRSRQKVTLSNTENNAIVAETIYDFYGRPAIEVLPTPSGTSSIAYYSAYNKNNSGVKYSWEDFDKSAVGCTNPVTASMSETTGSARYYSQQNPDKTQQQSLLPEANGFPFIQTEYDAENTGKIKRAGGAGTEFQLNDGKHHTRYFYGQPFQPELDRLFGAEAGYASHYQKNSVLDPNGQLSVSYIDMYGRTVATALAGDAPLQLAPFPGYGINPAALNEDILKSNNYLSADGNSLISEKEFIVTADKTNLIINYTFTGEQYHDDCMDDFCFDCAYDLEIEVINKECGNVLFTKTVSLPDGFEYDNSCGVKNSESPVSNQLISELGIGSYRITKKLTVRNEIANKYANNFIQYRDCVPVDVDNTLNTEGCCWDCNDCKQITESLDTYKTSIAQRITDENLSNTKIEELYKEAVKDCNDLCEETSPCESIAVMLLADVSLNGQYGEYYDETSKSIKPELFPLSVFNTSNKLMGDYNGSPSWKNPQKEGATPGSLVYADYVDEHGKPVLINYLVNGYEIDASAETFPVDGINYVKPQSLKYLKDFISVWKPSFAQSLVVYHPEYSYYRWCLLQDEKAKSLENKNISSNDFDRILSKAETTTTDFQKFQTNGVMPTISATTLFDNLVEATLEADPFFTTTTLGNQAGFGNSSSNPLCQAALFYYLKVPPTQYTTGRILMKELMLKYKRVKISSSSFGTYNIAQLAYLNNMPQGTSLTGLDIHDLITKDTYTDYLNYYLQCKKFVQEIMSDCFSKDNYHKINSILPPYSRKQKGLYIPFDYYGDFSYYNAFSFFNFDFKNSRTYNTFNIENAFTYVENSNPLKTIIPYPDNGELHKFIDRLGMHNNYFSRSALHYSPDIYAFSAGKKEKRVPKINDSYGYSLQALESDDDCDETEMTKKVKEKADYYRYLQTGQCPLAVQLEMLLNDLLEETTVYNGNTIFKLFSPNETEISESSLVKDQDLYVKLNGSASDIFKWKKVSNTDPTILEGEVSVNSVTRMKLEFKDPTGLLNWNNAKEFRSLNFTDFSSANNQTNVWVKVNTVDQNGLSKEFVLSGKIYNCVTNNNFTCPEMETKKECKANCETKSLMKLVSAAIYYVNNASSYVSGTDFQIPASLLGSIVNEECYKKLFYGSELISSVVIKANVNTTTKTVVIKRDDSHAIVTLQFDQNLTPLGDGFIKSVSSVDGSPSSFSCVYVGQTGPPTTLTGSITYQVTKGSVTYQPSYVVGECTPYRSMDCMTQYHYNKDELLRFINHLIADDMIVNGIDIDLLPGNYLNKYLLDAWGGYDDLKMKITIPQSNSNLATISIYRTSGQTTTEICSISIQKEPLSTTFTAINSVDFKSLLSPTSGNLSYGFNATGNYLYQGMPTKVSMQISSCLLISDCIPSTPCVPGKDLPLSAFSAVEYQKFDNDVPFTSNFTPIGFDPNTHEPVITSVSYSYFPNCTYSLPTEVSFYTNCSLKDQDDPGTGRFLTAHTSCPNTTIYKQQVKIKTGYQYKLKLDYAYNGDPILLDIKVNDKIISTEELNTSSNPTNGIGYQHVALPCNLSWHTKTFDFIYKAPYDAEVNLEIVNKGVTQDEILMLDNISVLEAKDCSPGTNFRKPVDETDSCTYTLLNIQANNNYVLNQQSEATAKREFIGRYKKKCLEALEALSISLNTKEYHYTLYYYDQAGNLTKTIPPKGVSLLTTQAQLDAVDAERQNGTVITRPPHTMATWYQYNTLNQVTTQTSPDGGTTEYWYDWLGRIIVSQNAKQLPDFKFSYTLYDNLGRISETGELINNAFRLDNDERFVKQADFVTWVAASTKANIVKTYYDIAAVTVPNFTPENLLNRVSAVAVYPLAINLASGTYSHATHYSYDIHGNVQTLIQDFPELEVYHNRYKRIDYQYDLISGNVNRVNYQTGRQDQFFHRYEYDADNRLTHAYTSRDGVIWEKEAKYFYYQHGSLARTETGDLQVQGLDYAYTLQGWIKGINSTLLEGDNDIGRDNNTAAANLHKYFAQDAASYSLKYFNNDFSPINTNYSSFIATNTNSSALYNGNIGVMATTIRHQNDYKAKPQQTVYNYDQLNRIYEMYVQNSINGNTWANSYSSDIYNESYFYDANGNITNLSRKDKDGNYLDNMTYNYQTGTNKLNYIADPYHPTSVDIEGQSSNNYTYDAIGNLTQDVKGGINDIMWNPYGKITHISKGSNGNLYYDYDAMGNRVKKNFTQSNDNADNTWYVRDASGNIMAIYSRKNYGTNQQVLLENYELYGSSRLGSLNLGIPVEGDYNLTSTTNYTRSLGLKQYELSNHLGNVLTTFSDQRVFAPTGMSSTNSNALTPKLISAQDYYPFGMIMDGRSWNEDKTKYSFNGQEKDREIYSNESITTALFWEYDGRIGRRWNRDPKPTVGISEYACLLDNPILYLDPDGDYSKLGAKLRNFFNGGNGISYTKSTGEWGYNKGTNEGVEYRDGLTQTERKQKIDDYKKTHYLHKEFGWIEIDQLNEYKPDFFDRWSESKNIFKKLLYGAFDDASVTVQNVFVKNLGDGNAYHLNGEMSTPKENTDAFVNISIDLVPEVKITKGLTPLKKMNAAQFSKIFKGNFSRLKPATRGSINKNINKTVDAVNNKISSGEVVKSSIPYLPKQDKDNK
jgi:YD repeat-containing protein